MDVVPEPLRTSVISYLILYQNYVIGLFLKLCYYIININQEVKVKLKCYLEDMMHLS